MATPPVKKVDSAQDCRAVLGKAAHGARAALGLLERARLAEIVGGAGVIAAVREGVVGAVERVPRIGAERSAVAARAAVAVDLGLAAVVADRRPALGAAPIAELDALDLQR